jgi:hypothetical protein
MPVELAHPVLAAAPSIGPMVIRGFSHAARTLHGGHDPQVRSLSGRHVELLEPAAGLS